MQASLCRAVQQKRGRGFVLPASSSVQLSSKGTGHSQVCPPSLGTDPHHPCRPCPLFWGCTETQPTFPLGRHTTHPIGRGLASLSSPRASSFLKDLELSHHRGPCSFPFSLGGSSWPQPLTHLLALRGVRQGPGSALGHA